LQLERDPGLVLLAEPVGDVRLAIEVAIARRQHPSGDLERAGIDLREVRPEPREDSLLAPEPDVHVERLATEDVAAAVELAPAARIEARNLLAPDRARGDRRIVPAQRGHTRRERLPRCSPPNRSAPPGSIGSRPSSAAPRTRPRCVPGHPESPAS